jgi:hypothetical protein
MNLSNFITQLINYFQADISNMDILIKQLTTFSNHFLKTGEIESFQKNRRQIEYVRNKQQQARYFIKFFKIIFQNKELKDKIKDTMKYEKDIEILAGKIEPEIKFKVKNN